MAALTRLAVVAVVLVAAVGLAILGRMALGYAWGIPAIAPRMVLNRSGFNSYQTAVRLTSEQTGAPQWYVRRVAPEPVYTAPCTEVRRNPLVWVNRILGFGGGAILTLIPFTAPFGAATLTAAGAVEAGLPPTVVRRCR